MTALVATDLDGTIVFSRRTAGIEGVAGLRAVEVRDGVASGWVTPGTERLLATLAERATWVPATTRSVAQFRRVRLPAARWAVCANGGVLLDDGVPDPSWAAHVGAVLGDVEPLEAVAADVARYTATVAAPLRVVDGLFLTAAVDRDPPSAAWSDELAATCAARGWTVHGRGTKLHVLPRGLTKSAAVAEIRRRGGQSLLLAAGDSLLDADLLRAADAAIRPAHGELHALGWDVDGLTVTASAGARAGEEIAAWLLDRASAVSRGAGRC